MATSVDKQSFNLALFPESKQFIDETIKLAQNNFASQSQEYLLGDNAWPHITLCQFSAEPSRLNEIWTAVSPLATKPLSIRLSQFYIWLYENAYWMGLGTMREPELISLQFAVYETLNTLGITANQKPSNYFPHITWARCGGDKPPTISILPNPEFWFQSHSFALSLGQSSPYGVYQKRLLPAEISK